MKKFDKFVSEKLSSKIKAEIDSKNPDHPYIKAFKNDKDFEEIKELWDSGEKREAAVLLRSKLVKMKNTKLGTSLLLMIAGTALASTGYDALKTPSPQPPIPAPPDDNVYTIKKGDSIWKIAKMHLPKGASNEEILAYTYQIAAQNGMKTQLIDAVLTKIPGDPDLIFPGGKLVLHKFLGLK